mmetsp:Transcript_37968/g.119107  ORF Transcript_37968/g.119107 Transcript_37968/m.119107 type:complete len:318 (-) Transcript_37968:1000-1953(-)
MHVREGAPSIVVAARDFEHSASIAGACGWIVVNQNDWLDDNGRAAHGDRSQIIAARDFVAVRAAHQARQLLLQTPRAKGDSGVHGDAVAGNQRQRQVAHPVVVDPATNIGRVDVAPLEQVNAREAVANDACAIRRRVEVHKDFRADVAELGLHQRGRRNQFGCYRWCKRDGVQRCGSHDVRARVNGRRFLIHLLRVFEAGEGLAISLSRGHFFAQISLHSVIEGARHDRLVERHGQLVVEVLHCCFWARRLRDQPFVDGSVVRDLHPKLVGPRIVRYLKESPNCITIRTIVSRNVHQPTRVHDVVLGNAKSSQRRGI